jgi:hypothetical protein
LRQTVTRQTNLPLQSDGGPYIITNHPAQNSSSERWAQNVHHTISLTCSRGVCPVPVKGFRAELDITTDELREQAFRPSVASLSQEPDGSLPQSQVIMGNSICLDSRGVLSMRLVTISSQGKLVKTLGVLVSLIARLSCVCCLRTTTWA